MPTDACALRARRHASSSLLATWSTRLAKLPLLVLLRDVVGEEQMEGCRYVANSNWLRRSSEPTFSTSWASR